MLYDQQVLECQGCLQATNEHRGRIRGAGICGGGAKRDTCLFEGETSSNGAAGLSDMDVRTPTMSFQTRHSIPLNSVLSAFEESSAACISDMLRQVSNGQYLDAIRMAEKFILHVEVLFASIDDLEFHFSRLNMKGE